MMEKDGQPSDGAANPTSATNESSSATPNTLPATPVDDMREDVPVLAPPLVALPQVNGATAAAAAPYTSANGASLAATAATAASVSSSSDGRRA